MEDKIELGDLDLKLELKNNTYKYSEDTILRELTDYISDTYNHTIHQVMKRFKHWILLSLW